MPIKARTFEKAFIETKPGIDKKGYLEQFAARAFSVAANGLYSTEIALDQKDFKPTINFIDLLATDSELASRIPLASVGKNPDAKFGDLPPELKRLCEHYPLVDSEQILSVKMLCLKETWQGLPNHTVFVERETNQSRVYFAVPSLRADPQSPDVTPALLLRLNSGPVARAALANAAPSGRLGAAAALPPAVDDMVQCSLDVISSLAWAIPEAGPYVSAAITFGKFLIGFLFPSQHEDQQLVLLGNIKNFCNGVVSQLETFIDMKELKASFGQLKSFSKWIENEVTKPLNTTSSDTIRRHAPQLLALLELEFNPAGPSILAVKNGLYGDPDLAPDKPYESPNKFAIASAKLNLLPFVVAHYLLVVKLKMSLTATLYELGFDDKGNPLDLGRPNPDNTFTLLVAAVENLKSELPQLIENVRARREGMIVLKEGVGCTVAYSQEQKRVADRGDWKLNRHDALYTGDYHDQLVRSIEDNPSTAEFERKEKRACTTPVNCVVLGHEVLKFSWERSEVRDGAVYDGQHPQDWVLDNGKFGSSGYQRNTARVQAVRAEYVAGVLRQFDKLAKIPDALAPATLEAALTKSSAGWTPQIPKEWSNNVGLIVSKWTETSAGSQDDELWSDPKVTVMYRFTLRGAAGTESVKPGKDETPDKTTTVSWLEPLGKKCPEIKGLPTEGKDLDYVHFVCVYRQFRRALGSGGYKYGKERKIKMIGRDSTKKFSGSFIDNVSTEFDKKDLA